MSVFPRFLEGAAFGVLNNILSEYHSAEGYAESNKYEVEIFPPASKAVGLSANAMRDAASSVPVKDLKSISLRASSVTLPGRALGTTNDTNIYGPLRSVVDGVTYDDTIEIAFQPSAELDERVLFEKWQYAAFNPQTWNMGYYNNYVGTVYVYLLDKQMNRRYGLKLWECFPKTVSAIPLSYGTNDTLATFTVSMNFRYWTTADQNQQPPSLADKIGQTIVNTVERNLSRALPAVLRRF